MAEFMLVGGPNGSGKSTFIREYLESRPLRYLCADEVAFELDAENPEAVAVQAGRIFLKRIREASEKGDDVIVESTLAGKSFQKIVESYRDAGYRIRVLFVTPLDVEENVARVRMRSVKGGHSVPEIDIRRRFQRAHVNFWNIYRHLARRWTLYANRDEIRIVAEGRDQRFLVKSPKLFDRFSEITYHVQMMSEAYSIFSEDDIEWFEEMEAIMKRAVAKAKAENERLGLNPEDFRVDVSEDLNSAED